jgi:ABC-type transport system involved in cytochrome bd biosynthesis fused ATPase/permease subunit
MRDNFENIRAERDVPLQRANTPSQNYVGLWKQIALGIIVGYSALGLLSAMGWLIFAKLAMGTLQIAVP